MHIALWSVGMYVDCLRPMNRAATNDFTSTRDATD